MSIRGGSNRSRRFQCLCGTDWNRFRGKFEGWKLYWTGRNRWNHTAVWGIGISHGADSVFSNQCLVYDPFIPVSILWKKQTA